MTTDELYHALVELAHRHLGENVAEYDTDFERVFSLLVDSVVAYSSEWERRDVERAQRNAEREAQHLTPEPRSLADLTARPRWDLTLEAIGDIIESS